jgi:thymidylate kinase
MLQALATTPITDPVPDDSLSIARDLLIQLESCRVRYCHWKSNESLRSALAGQGDLDLLIDGRDTTTFEAVLFVLGFKEAAQDAWLTQRSIRHYYGLDSETGRLLHVHVYFQLVTGGVVLKNYRLPFETQLIEQGEIQLGVPVPPRSVELMVFVVRKMLEAGDPVELLLQRMDREHVQRELRWLFAAGDATVAQAQEWLKLWMPQVHADLFQQAVDALQAKAPVWHQFLLGRRFRRASRPLALRGPVSVGLNSVYRLSRRLLARVNRRTRKRLSTGGRVIALVGPEASGKSTTAEELRRWLHSSFHVQTVHVGKPRSSCLSYLPNLLRRMTKRIRRHEGSSNDQSAGRRNSWAYAFASVLLARDRARVCRAAFRNTSVVICDRYPTSTLGEIDGPRLDPIAKRGWKGTVWRWLARVESRYYRTVPRPDVTVQLSVPVDVAVRRNRGRVKTGKESDQYLVQRHSQFAAGHWTDGPTSVQVDTSRAMDEVNLELKKLVWRRL